MSRDAIGQHTRLLSALVLGLLVWVMVSMTIMRGPEDAASSHVVPSIIVSDTDEGTGEHVPFDSRMRDTVLDDTLDKYLELFIKYYKRASNTLAAKYRVRFGELRLLERAKDTSNAQYDCFGLRNQSNALVNTFLSQRIHDRLHNRAKDPVCFADTKWIKECRSQKTLDELTYTREDMLRDVDESALQDRPKAWKKHLIASIADYFVVGQPEPQDDQLLTYRYRFDPDEYAFETCAIVGTSGNLLYAEHGEDIDSHDVVIRTNLGKTATFEKHVGSRTTLRITGELTVDYEYCDEILVHRDHLRMSKTALQWFWSIFPGEYSLLLHEKIMEDQYNKLLMHFNNRTTHDYRSVGMISILFALPLCSRITVYGYNSYNQTYPRHYYENYMGRLYHEPSDEACVIEGLRRNGLLNVVDWEYDPEQCPDKFLKSIPETLFE